MVKTEIKFRGKAVYIDSDEPRDAVDFGRFMDEIQDAAFNKPKEYYKAKAKAALYF